MPQEIGPEAQRRLDMKRLAITEVELKRLKKLAVKDPDEARFHIAHEHKVQIQWTGDRTAFILFEVFGPPEKPTSNRGAGEVVKPRGNPGQSIRGDKIG